MSWEKPQRLMGDSGNNSDWIPQTRKKWVPPVEKPKRWGTNLPKPRKQWTGKNNYNSSKGGKAK